MKTFHNNTQCLKPSLAAYVLAEGESQVWLMGWIVQTNRICRHHGRDSLKPMPPGECTPKQKHFILAELQVMESQGQPGFPRDTPGSCSRMMCSPQPYSHHHLTEPPQYPASPCSPRLVSLPGSVLHCSTVAPGFCSPWVFHTHELFWSSVARHCTHLGTGAVTDLVAPAPEQCEPETNPSLFCQLIHQTKAPGD